MAQNLDFTRKDQFPMSTLIDQMAQKAQRESALHNDALQRGQNMVSNIQQAATATSQMVSDMVARSRQKLIDGGKKELIDLYGRAGTPVPAPGSTMVPPQQPIGPMTQNESLVSGPVQGPSNPSAMTTYGQTPEFQNKVKAALFKAAPDVALKQAAEQAFTEKGPGTATSRYGSGMPQPLSLKDGTNILATFDRNTMRYYYANTNEEVPANLIEQRAYSPSSQFKYVQDPTNLRWYRHDVAHPEMPPTEVTPGEATVGGVSQGQEIPFYKRPLVERNAIKAAVSENLNDDTLKSAQASLQTIGNFGSIFKQDLSASGGALKSLAARVIAGEKGVLTDKDVERVTGSSDIMNRFNRLVRTIYDGKQTDQDYREFQSILDTVKSRSTELYEQSSQVARDSLSTQYGISDREAKILMKYVPAEKILRIQERGDIKEPSRRPVGVAEPSAKKNPQINIKALGNALGLPRKK